MPPKSRGKAGDANKRKPNISNEKTLPKPFLPAPDALQPLLSILSTKHVYITHIDPTPRNFKKNIFLVPVLMNVGAMLLVLWRIKSIGPYYLNIILSVLGDPNETTMNPEIMTWPELIYEVCYRAFQFLTDLFIYFVLLPWPRGFFIGRGDIGTPVGWRYATGFRDREIVIRRSRSWDEHIGDFLQEGDGPGFRQFSGNVRLATSNSYMNGRTGYSMLNKEWDLDFHAMAESMLAVDSKEMTLEDFRTTILLHSEAFGWVVFETDDAAGSKKEEEGRNQIISFKDELTAMGKENLFFKWIELIQYESAQPGGFGPDRQAEAMRKAKEMFEAQGVDFEKFWEKIGGMQSMPGMEPVEG